MYLPKMLGTEVEPSVLAAIYFPAFIGGVIVGEL